MAVPLQQWTQNVPPAQPAASPEESEQLLTVSRAWHTIRRRTGIPLSRATFYRWVGSGKVFSLRMGLKAYIPTSIVDGMVKQCKSGDPVWPESPPGRK